MPGQVTEPGSSKPWPYTVKTTPLLFNSDQ